MDSDKLMIWGIVTGSQVIDGVFHRNQFVVNQYTSSEAWAGGVMLASGRRVRVPMGRIEYCYELTEDETTSFWDSMKRPEDGDDDGVAAPA